MSNEIQGLHNLIAPAGARKRHKRVGRGESSGMGKTSGRGMKGQKARKSGGVRPGFEGGQLPLARRQPKRGFKNALFRKNYAEVNVGKLNERFEAGASVSVFELIASGLVANAKSPIKVLGNGELTIALNLKVNKVSKSAQAKIEAAGGSIEIVK